MASAIRNATVRARHEKKIEQDKEKAEKELAAKHKKNQIAMAWVAGAQGVMQIWAAPGPAGMASPILFALKLAQTAALVALTMKQVEQIKAQEYAQGGYISGNSHAQGGVPIEAEGGEFIFSRDAVKRYGTRYLEAMNNPQNHFGLGGYVPSARKKRGSDITINVSFEGNLMSDEYFEDEALPRIQDALRRGLDLGVT